ncbi:MAG: sulfotransferase, partial [Gammaproteobacteria bacterium]|nr:sulfotransferase [Gammaproteobacteria bacterium]
LQISPDYAEAHNNLGTALTHLGMLDDAIASYGRALEIRPDYAEAHRNLSDLSRYRPDDAHLDRMLALLGRDDLPARDRMLLCFAVGKAYGDVGDHDKAFAYLSSGNRLRKEQLNYSIAPTRDAFASIMSVFSGALPRLNVAEESEAKGLRQPIFIVGMPRSGTTLVEQILASHSKIHGAGELRLLDQAVNATEWDSAPPSKAQLSAIRESYLGGLAAIGDAKPYLTDKMPFNFLWIGFIVTAIPEAKIVHVERDARATCWSNFKHFFVDRRTGFTNDLRDVAEYYVMYAKLMSFWEQKFPSRIYNLSYESLTEHQEEQTRKLLEHIGLEWEPQCLEFHKTRRAVSTASSTQVRQKIYRGSSDEWRHYRRHLEPMIEALEGL